MLSISSLFFKNCVQTYEHYEVLKILLPDYSFEATYSFLSFLYSGEVLMEKCLQTEFLALCEEFKVEIPNLKSLMENENNINPTEEDVTEIENNPIEELTEVEERTPTYEQPESVFICEESIENAIEFQGEDNVEDNNDLHEYYTIEEYPKKIDPNVPDIDKIAQMIFDGEIRLLKAAEFYQIPKSTLHRRLQKIRTGYREIKNKINPNLSMRSVNIKLEAAVKDVMSKALTFSGAELKYGISKSIIFRTVHDRKQSENPTIMTQLQISNKAKVRARASDIADQNYSKNLDLAEESIIDEGLTVMDAARKFGIPKTSMYRHMSKVKTDSTSTETSLQDAIEEVLNGNPLSPTALKYNVSKSTLHRHVQRKSKQMIDEMNASL